MFFCHRSFVTFLCSLANDEKREKTALDDILAALQYVVDSAAAVEPAKKKSKRQREKSDDHSLSTIPFCVSIFMEFAFQSEVVVNGKLIKVYSSLRSELQQIMLSAQETFTAEASEGKQVDAMEFAALLTQQFADKPVMSVVSDDEEEACAKRATSTMNIATHQASIVKPLQEFVAKQLHLPLLLHPMCQQTILELSSALASADSSMKNIVDLVAFIQSKLEDLFPFAWVLFASDISEVFVCKGHFIEHSGEARLGWDWVPDQFLFHWNKSISRPLQYYCKIDNP